MLSTIEADIEGIAHSIWDTLFDLALEAGSPDAPTIRSSVTSVVHINGAWNGAITMVCPMTLARTLSAAMFGGDGDAGLDEVRDALGEVTNMIAGNVKALLPEPCSISLPTVAFGTEYEVVVPRTEAVATVPFRCDGQPLVVTLLERATEPRPAER